MSARKCVFLRSTHNSDSLNVKKYSWGFSYLTDSTEKHSRELNKGISNFNHTEYFIINLLLFTSLVICVHLMLKWPRKVRPSFLFVNKQFPPEIDIS